MGRAERGRRSPFRVALTGGIASGKSTVAQLFMALGAGLIDTDQIAREIVAPGSPTLTAIVERFGSSMLTPEGTLDRARLREQVFRDPQARADLEALTHPEIHAQVGTRSARSQAPYLLVAVPLLVEGSTQDQYDRVLVVDSDPALQLRRLMLRDGIDRDSAQRMIASQATREQRLAVAHDVIHNDGDIAALASRVEALHKAYLDASGYAK